MAGTKEGGKKAAAKNLAKNPNFYAEIGRKGGVRGKTGGFATPTPCDCGNISQPHVIAQCAGKKGGFISRKRAAQLTPEFSV